MCNLSWSPPLLEKDNSKINPANSTQNYECPQYSEEGEEMWTAETCNAVAAVQCICSLVPQWSCILTCHGSSEWMPSRPCYETATSVHSGSNLNVDTSSLTWLAQQLLGAWNIQLTSANRTIRDCRPPITMTHFWRFFHRNTFNIMAWFDQRVWSHNWSYLAMVKNPLINAWVQILILMWIILEEDRATGILLLV